MLIGKTVTYFIGNVQSTKVTISTESKDFAWVTKEQARKITTHKSILDLLAEADQFLNQLEKKS